MSHGEVGEQILCEFSAIAEASGCSLLECRFAGGVLRLVLDHPGGVTLEHCEEVSRQVSSFLDVEDFGPGKYTLEVTSPGLDRKFYSDEDYERFRGRKVRVTWQDSDMTPKRTDIGILVEFRPESRQILLQTGDSAPVREISLSDIKVARLEPEF